MHSAKRKPRVAEAPASVAAPAPAADCSATAARPPTKAKESAGAVAASKPSKGKPQAAATAAAAVLPPQQPPPPPPPQPRGHVHVVKMVTTFPTAPPTPADVAAMHAAFVAKAGERATQGITPAMVAADMRDYVRREATTDDERIYANNDRKAKLLQPYLDALQTASVLPSLLESVAEERRAKDRERYARRKTAAAVAAAAAAASDSREDDSDDDDGGDGGDATAKRRGPAPKQLSLVVKTRSAPNAMELWKFGDLRALDDAAKPRLTVTLREGCDKCASLSTKLSPYGRGLFAVSVAPPLKAGDARGASDTAAAEDDDGDAPRCHTLMYTLPGGGSGPVNVKKLDEHFAAEKRRAPMPHQSATARLFSHPAPAFGGKPASRAPPAPHVTVLSMAMGSGKTLAALLGAYAAIAHDWSPDSAPRRVVIACPVGMVRDWEAEVTRGPPLPPHVAAHVAVLGHDELKKQVSANPGWLRDAIVILDEAQWLRGMTKDGAYVIECLAHAARLFLLSGTFLQNDPEELWPVMALMRLRSTAGDAKTQLTAADALAAVKAAAAAEADAARKLARIKGGATEADLEAAKAAADAVNSRARPSGAVFAARMTAQWPQLAVLHYSPTSDPSVLGAYPSASTEILRVPMSWPNALEYRLAERALVTLCGLTLQTSQRNSYRGQTRMLCNTDAKLRALAQRLGHVARGDGAGTYAPGEPLRPGERVRQLVYSHYIAEGVDRVVEQLRAVDVGGREPLRVRVITGATLPEERFETVAAYNRGDAHVCVLSECGTVGLTLLGTTAFYLLEPHLNVHAEGQTVARAMRYMSHVRRTAAAPGAPSKRKSAAAKDGGGAETEAPTAAPEAAAADGESSSMAQLLAALAERQLRGTG